VLANAGAAPVAYWSFDIDARDAGTFHNGTLVGDAAITTGNQGFGGSGEALAISGGSAHMSAGNPTALDFNSDFTWHAYIKTSDGSGAIFSRNPAGTAWNQGSKALFVRGNNVQWDTGWVGAPGTGTAVNDGQWHQVIATYDAGSDQLNIFIDPVAGATAGQYSGTHNVNSFDESGSHNGGSANTSFTIGQADFSGGLANLDMLEGLIDEAAVFDSALAGADLDQLITQGPASFFGPVDPPDPTGDHPFISEFVAVGNDNHQDGDGDTPDWIEIYNPTGDDIDLDGYHLTDETGNLTKWTFPSTLLQAGRYLVVFASDKNRAVAGQELHLNFKLASGGDYLALVEPDGTTIISEFSPIFPAQVAGFSYGIGGLAPDDTAGYFASASPGSNNGTLLSSPLVAPILSPPCDTFATSTSVTITPAFPGAEIRYTTNGSAPTSASTLYTTPVSLSSTTHLRARAFDPGTGGGGEIASGSFQKLATTSNLGGINSPNTFTSDLPIMIVENFNAGGVPGPGSTLQTARVSVFEPDPITGRSSLSADPDACFRIGIRRRGQSSSGFAKPQYRVELRDESDVDLDYPLLGLPSESDWVFNGPHTDKSLVRNAFSFELGREIGVEAPRTKHFEMFLNTNGGDLASADYVGVYVLFEKIKQGKNRTDITEMSPTDNTAPEVTGGYMMRFEPPGIAGQGIRATGWNSVEILQPDSPTTQQRAYLGQYFDDFVATLGWSRGSGANNSGIVNPDPITGYPAFIDVDSFVNMHIVTELGRDQDAYVRSDYMHKDRNGKLKKGPLWDHNLIMGTGCCFDNKNPIGWQYQNNYNRGGRDHNYEPDWFVPLMRDPDFRQQVIDRWTELRRDGALEMNNLFARLDAQADPLAEAAVRNFTKWNTLGQNGPGFGSPSTSTWDEQIDFIKNWLIQRLGWIDSEFLSAPELTPAGGVVVAGGSGVTVQSAEPVYYTTDGSDPRLPGGGINPTAQQLPPSAGEVPITIFARGTEWAFLDDGSNQGASDIVAGHPSYGTGNWKHPDFDDAAWLPGDGILGFGNLGSPAAPIATPLSRGPAGQQHRTYYFRRTFSVANAASVISLSGEVLRDDGVIVYLNGKEIARSNIADGLVLGYEDLTGGSPASGNDEDSYQTFTLDPGDLVEGENLIAVELHQESTGSSDVGFDLELDATIPPGDAPTVSISGTTQLRTRARAASGEWSAPSEGIFVVGTAASAANLTITELNYHPSDPTPTEAAADPTYRDDDFEFIEFKNTSASEIDLSGVSFVDGITFTVPATTILQPGAYALIVENQAAFEQRYSAGLPIIGTYADKFSNDGESLRLVDIEGNDIANFTFNDTWYQPTDGDGYTLVPVDEDATDADRSNPASWGISCLLLGTPGAANGGVLSHTFEGWLNYHFDAAERADQSISGPLADRDGDGIATLIEFALELNPNRSDSSGLPSADRIMIGEDDYQTISFKRPQKVLGMTYQVEMSSDLQTWTPDPVAVGVPSDNGDGTETVTYRDPDPIGQNPRRALRLRISLEND
jgi:hypothetical protein